MSNNNINVSNYKIKQEYDLLEEKLKEFKTSLEENDKLLSDAQATYHKEKSRLDTMKNISERYDGYSGSIKKVMKHKGKDKGIIGVVADIITVDKEYETAIETVLGRDRQSIVTEDENVATKMINFLKEQKSGSVTFLPLTIVKDKCEFNRPEVRNEKGFIGMASELVHVDKKFSDVVSRLLGSIIVVDNMNNALEIAKKYKYLLRIVTLEGEYLTPDGTFSGGAYRNTRNLFGRKREIEKLEGATKRSFKRIEEIMDKIESIMEMKRDVIKKIEELQEQLDDGR